MSTLDFDKERLAVLQTRLAAIDEVITAFATNGGLVEYEYDSGQGRQQVKRSDLSQLRLAEKDLENRIRNLLNRINGCGAYKVDPAW